MKDVHTEHCCIVHGCKYCDDECTVATGKAPQSYLCEDCNEDAWQKIHVRRLDMVRNAKYTAKEFKTRIQDIAWDIYCEETRNDLNVLDFWEQLRPDVQSRYLAKAFLKVE